MGAKCGLSRHGYHPALAEILGVSVEELLNAKAASAPVNKGAEAIVDIVLKAVPLTIGVAVVVTGILGQLEITHGMTMLGIGLVSIGIYLFKHKD